MIEKYSTDEEIEFWNKYARAGLTHYEQRAIQQLIHGGTRVLDIGCGCGRATIALAQMDARVCALDIAPRMTQVTKANVLACDIQARAVCADICEGIPFKGQFDVALLLEQVYQHIPLQSERQKALLNIRNQLAPGGAIVLAAFNEGDVNIGHRIAWLRATDWQLAAALVLSRVDIRDSRYTQDEWDVTHSSPESHRRYGENMRIFFWSAKYLLRLLYRKVRAKLNFVRADSGPVRCKRITRTNPLIESKGAFLLSVLSLPDIFRELITAGFDVESVHPLLELDKPFSPRAKLGAPIYVVVAKPRLGL